MQTFLGLHHPFISLGRMAWWAKRTSAWEAIKSITLHWSRWHDIGMILAMMACLQAKCCVMCKRCASSLADTLNGLGMENCLLIIIEFSQKHITPCFWFSYLAIQTPATQATVIIEDSTPLTQIPKGESKNKKKKERENHSGRWKYVELTNLVPLAELHWNGPKSQSVCPALLLSVSRRQLSAWWSNLGLKVCFLNITLLVSGRCALENASYMHVVRPGLSSQPWNGVETWKEKTPARRRGKTLLKALGIVSF